MRNFLGPVVQLCQKVDLGLEAIQEVEAQIEEVKTKNEVVDDDFDVDDIFEEDVEEVAAEEATSEAEEAAAEVEEAVARSRRGGGRSGRGCCGGGRSCCGS